MLLHSLFMYTLHSILNNCIQYCICSFAWTYTILYTICVHFTWIVNINISLSKSILCFDPKQYNNCVIDTLSLKIVMNPHSYFSNSGSLFLSSKVLGWFAKKDSRGYEATRWEAKRNICKSCNRESNK